MCGVQLKDRKKYTDLMLMLKLNEFTDQLAMVNSVRWYGHVLSGGDVLVMRRALYLEVERQRTKGRSKKTCRKHVEEESMKVSL